MIRYYLIVPAALLGLFLVVERPADRLRRQREGERAEKVAADKTKADEERRGREKLAAKDLARRNAEREKQDQEKLEKKQRDHEAALANLESAAAKSFAEVAAVEREIAALEEKLTATRAAAEQHGQAAFALLRQVERQRVDRRNAELEIQRATKVVMLRLRDGPLGRAGL